MMRIFHTHIAAAFLLTLMVLGSPAQARSTTASLDADDAYLDSVGVIVADPLEGMNRAIFSFNDRLLNYVMRPLSDGYVFIAPKPVRTGIGNVFHNLLFPVRFTNNLLQGKGRAAGVEMSRFILNTTAGIGGIFNVAANHKPIVPVPDDEDLGQTFGVWGAGEGFYLVLPVLGPSTLRDTGGLVGDYFLDPFTYVTPDLASFGLKGGRALNNLEAVLDGYDALHKSAVEPYSAFRDAYVQFRRAQIADTAGGSNAASMPIAGGYSPVK